jgi:hypothetical protein
MRSWNSAGSSAFPRKCWTTHAGLARIAGKYLSVRLAIGNTRKPENVTTATRFATTFVLAAANLTDSSNYQGGYEDVSSISTMG